MEGRDNNKPVCFCSAIGFCMNYVHVGPAALNAYTGGPQVIAPSPEVSGLQIARLNQNERLCLAARVAPILSY
jgi:hypothetical protein